MSGLVVRRAASSKRQEGNLYRRRVSRESRSARTVVIAIPSLDGGGAEKVTVNLANGLARRGYSVDMVLAKATGPFLSDLCDVRVVDLNVKRLRGMLFPLSRHLRLVEPAAILACMWPVSVIGLLARRLAGLESRIVVAEHTTWSKDPVLRAPLSRLAARTTMIRTFPWADGVVAVSHGAADDLARFSGLPRKHISVIHNPVVGRPNQPSELSCAAAGWWSGRHSRVLAVGSLNSRKDHLTLLNAFSKLRETVDARLLILGEGEARPSLESQIRLLGLDGYVFMPGFVKDPTPYFQQANLTVLSSTVEALPTVLIEALAVGTPVVSTDCPSGPREILADGKFGRLSPVGDPEALAEAMAESLTCTHDKPALIARSKDFAIETAVDQYERLLVGH